MLCMVLSACALVRLRGKEPPVFLPSSAELLALAFMGYAALSVTWSSDWRTGLDMFSHFAAAAGIYVVFRSLDLRPLAGAALLLISGLALTVTNAGFGNENWQAEAVLALLPLAMAARNRAFGLGSACLGAVVLSVANGSDTTLAVAIAWVVLGAFYLWRRGHRWLAAIIVFGVFDAALLAGWYLVPLETFRYRLEFAYNTVRLIGEAPIFGHGLGSFGYEYFRHQYDHLAFEWWRAYPPAARGGIVVDRAHNELLQGFAQFGLVGMWLALGALATWFKVWRPTWPEGAALVAIGVISLIAFPLQNPATLVVALAILAQGAAPTRRFVLQKRYILAAVPVVLMLFVGSGASFMAAQAWAQTHRLYNVRPAAAFAANWHAYKLYPLERRYRRQLFPSFLHAITSAEAHVDAGAVSRVYEISDSAARYWPNLREAAAAYQRLQETADAP